MGYANLSVEAKGVLQEIARLAYGTGSKQGRSGGAGRMGLLNGPEGKVRVVKFNTHWTERWTGPSAGPEMWQSSNRLRSLLLQLASSAGLEAGEMNRVRALLKLPPGQDSVNKLLDRRTVAQVVTLIGGDEVWNDALDGHGDMSDYRSAEHASFADLTDQAFAQTTGVKNVKTVDETKNLNGIYTQFSDTLGKSTDSYVLNCSAALYQRFAGLDVVLMREGYLSSLTQRTVAAKIQRLFRDIGQFAKGMQFTEEEKARQAGEVADFARSRIRMLLNADKYVLATYGKDAYQDVRVLEKFGVSPEDLELQIIQMARKYGFSDDERKTIFQIAARQMAQTLREKESAEAQEKANEMNAGLQDGMSVAVFAGMVACRVGNETRRNEIIQNVGQLENQKAKRLLDYFDNLSGVGGFDDNDRWNAFGTYLGSIDPFDFYSKFIHEAFFLSRERDVESYRADAVAVNQLNAEIDDFCNAHGEEYRNILKVPARSFAACVGFAKPSSYCEPYARYRFELVKRIVTDGFLKPGEDGKMLLDYDKPGKDKEMFLGYDLVPRRVELTVADVEKMVDGKFDELKNVDLVSVKNFMVKMEIETLMNLPFQAEGPNGGVGTDFANALDRLVSEYPQDKKSAVKGIFLSMLERKLRANGPILGPDSLQAVVGSFFKGEWEDMSFATDSSKLEEIFMSVPADDLVAIHDSGIDLLKIVNLTGLESRTADGHLLALLVKSQQAGQASFAGREDELVEKIGLFEKFIRSDAMPPELRFNGNDKAQCVLAIIASAYPKIVDFVNAVSAGNVTDDAKIQFFTFVQSRMEKFQDFLSQLARHMVGNEASQEEVGELLNRLMTDVYFHEDGMEILKAIGDDGELKNLLDRQMKNYDYFGSVRKNAEELLDVMRKLGVFDRIRSVNGILDDEPRERFVKNGILQPLPADHSEPTGYSAKMTERMNDRKKALEKYDRIRKEEYDGTSEARIRTTAAEIVMRLLGSLNVKYFRNEDNLNNLFELLCRTLRKDNGVFNRIDACIRDMGTAATDAAKAEIMVRFYSEMKDFASEVMQSEALLSNCPNAEDVYIDGDDTCSFLYVMLDAFITADSRLSSAFDDLMRTNIGLLNEIQIFDDYDFIGDKEKELQLWEDYGLDARQGILDADDVKRLTHCGLTPSVIKDQIAPTVTRFGLKEDEQKTVVQAIVAILANRIRGWGGKSTDLKDVDVNVLPDVKEKIRQVLEGLADGTSGVLVAGMLLCKGGDPANAALWKERLQNICKWNPSNQETDTKEARLVMITDKQGEILKVCFDLAVNRMNALAGRNGGAGGDRQRRWEEFSRFILMNNANGLAYAAQEDFLKEWNRGLDMLEADVKAVRQLNKEINDAFLERFPGDVLPAFARPLKVPEQLSFADILGGPTEMTIRSPQAKLRLALIKALPTRVAMLNRTSPGQSQVVELTPNEFYAVLNGDFDKLTHLPAAVVDRLRTAVAKTAFDAIMNLEYRRDGVEVPENVKTVSDHVGHVMSFLSDEKKTYCRRLLSRAFERWLRDHPLKLTETALSDVVETLTGQSASTLVGRVTRCAAEISTVDLQVIEAKGIDVLEVSDKVETLRRTARVEVNNTAFGHVLALLLQGSNERDPAKLAELIVRFFSVLAKWWDSEGKGQMPQSARGVLTIAASLCLDVAKLRSKDGADCVDFSRANGLLLKVTSVLNAVAKKIVGQNAEKADLDKSVQRLFEKLSRPQNGERVFLACGSDDELELLRNDLGNELDAIHEVQTEGQALQQAIRTTGLLREEEIPNLKALLGSELMEEFYKGKIMRNSQSDTFEKLKTRIAFRRNAIEAYSAMLGQSAEQGSVEAQAATVMLHLLGRLPVKMLSTQDALDALFNRLKQEFEVILGNAQPYLTLLNESAMVAIEKRRALVALVQMIVRYASRYCSPKDGLSKLILPPGSGADEYGELVPGITNALGQVVFGGNEAVTATLAQLKTDVVGDSNMESLVRAVYIEPPGLNPDTASVLYNEVIKFFKLKER